MRGEVRRQDQRAELEITSIRRHREPPGSRESHGKLEATPGARKREKCVRVCGEAGL